MAVELQLDGGAQQTPNGRINTGTDNILSYMALFGLLNATKDGRVLPHEFRAGKDAWNACYDLFQERKDADCSVRLPPVDRDPEKTELLFAGILVKYDSLLPSDVIVSMQVGLFHDKELGRLNGVSR